MHQLAASLNATFGVDTFKAAPVKTLSCDGGWSCCNHVVSMLGSKGYVYCGPCGLQRRAAERGRERVRKLTPVELRKLQAGETLTTY